MGQDGLAAWVGDPFWQWLSDADPDELGEWTFSEIVLVALARGGE